MRSSISRAEKERLLEVVTSPFPQLKELKDIKLLRKWLDSIIEPGTQYHWGWYYDEGVMMGVKFDIGVNRKEVTPLFWLLVETQTIDE